MSRAPKPARAGANPQIFKVMRRYDELDAGQCQRRRVCQPRHPKAWNSSSNGRRNDELHQENRGGDADDPGGGRKMNRTVEREVCVRCESSPFTLFLVGGGGGEPDLKVVIYLGRSSSSSKYSHTGIFLSAYSYLPFIQIFNHRCAYFPQYWNRSRTDSTDSTFASLKALFVAISTNKTQIPSTSPRRQHLDTSSGFAGIQTTSTILSDFIYYIPGQLAY